MVESDIRNRLIKLSQSSDWLLQVLFIDTFSALISFGTYLCFGDIQSLIFSRGLQSKDVRSGYV